MSNFIPSPAVHQVNRRIVPDRVVSIDIFRGLTMVVMIFVNELDGTKGLPWWTFHMSAEIDAMTYVDMVFPAFLFAVGLSLPFAIERRLAKDPSLPRLWRHILQRTLALVVLGLILANAGMASLKHWGLFALIGAILYWNVYPTSERYEKLFQICKWTGLFLMLVMFAIFRRTTATGQTAWIDFSYWEILGLIGWTYLAVCLLYVPTRRHIWAPALWVGVLLALNVATLGHLIPSPQELPYYVWPFGSGAFPLMTMAGVVTSTIFLREQRLQTFRRKANAALLFALASCVLGWLAAPLGISKIRETPTWCLACIGANVLLFTLLYWICDVKKKTRWSAFAKPAGSNTLLTYLLPDLYEYAFGAFLGVAYFASGWQGVMKAMIFTACILAVSALLTRWKLRLQL